MAAKTVLNYLPRESVIHKMTGTTKLAFFLLFTFASMITYNTWVLLGLLVVSLLAFRLSRIKFREVRFMMTFMLVFLLLNNLFIFLFDPNQGTTLYGTRTVLCHLFWRYDLTAEQLFYMINISLKYFVALPVAILFISATDPSEFAASLNSIGISYKVGYSVAIALRYIPDIQRDYHSISQAQRDNISGQLDLFGGDEPGAKPAAIPIPQVEEYSSREKMAMEKETTGIYISGHPMDDYRPYLRNTHVVHIGSLMEEDNGFQDDQIISVAGIVQTVKMKTTRNNSMMAYVTVEDDTASIEMLAFSNVLDQYGGYLRENLSLIHI